MTNWAKTPHEVIGAAPKCRIVSRLGIGLDNIDVAYCSAHGIPVTNVPDYCLIEVAEHALAQLLACRAKSPSIITRLSRGVISCSRERRCCGSRANVGHCRLGKHRPRAGEEALGIGLKVVATSRSQKNPLPARSSS